MGRGKSGESALCHGCGKLSDSVHDRYKRKIQHYSINGMEIQEISTIVFKCRNENCAVKTFIHVVPFAGIEEVSVRGRYTKSSKSYVGKKLLKRQISYNSLCAEIKEDFGGKTSISTLHTWTQQMKVVDAETEIESVEVLHTDEKHPSKKKKK